MKELEKMTRKELANFIVNNQIERGIIKAERKNVVLKGYLNGLGFLKAQSKMELLKAAKSMI